MSGAAALGVDFGTSHTVAIARAADGRVRPLLVDGSPLLPSAVYAQPDGALVVGRDAVHSARLDPARFEPNPKRRIDDGSVLLGDREVAVTDLVTAVLARVAEEWRRAYGYAPPRLTLTCPASWGATRRGLLADAADRAGLGKARVATGRPPAAGRPPTCRLRPGMTSPRSGPPIRARPSPAATPVRSPGPSAPW
jgi:molecular chaperone DnaK (HSP70)